MKTTRWHFQRGIAKWLFLMAMGGVLVMTSTETVAASRQPVLPAGLTAPAQPTTMPDFQLPQVNGTMFHTADVRGKIVLMRFWATW